MILAAIRLNLSNRFHSWGFGLEPFYVNETVENILNSETYAAKLLVLATQVHSNMTAKWLCDDDADEDNKFLGKYTAPDI